MNPPMRDHPDGCAAERHWSNEDFSILDDRPANTLRNIALATGAMFVAFLAAEWVYEALFSGSETRVHSGRSRPTITW